MVADQSGISDDLAIELNGSASGPNPDDKGPDAEQWPLANRETSRRKVDKYDEGEPGIGKGPHPDEWSDEAREERGAAIVREDNPPDKE